MDGFWRDIHVENPAPPVKKKTNKQKNTKKPPKQKNQNNNNKKLEPVFIKQYALNSLPLTVNRHHVLFVKSLPRFSKRHNSEKVRWLFFLEL